MNLIKQPPIRAVSMSLFPTMDSLDEVIALAKDKHPQDTSNEVVGLLMTYHNTMLKVMSQGTNHVRSSH